MVGRAISGASPQRGSDCNVVSSSASDKTLAVVTRLVEVCRWTRRCARGGGRDAMLEVCWLSVKVWWSTRFAQGRAWLG